MGSFSTPVGWVGLLGKTGPGAGRADGTSFDRPALTTVEPEPEPDWHPPAEDPPAEPSHPERIPEPEHAA